jgi:hypothetical protein
VRMTMFYYSQDLSNSTSGHFGCVGLFPWII